MKIGSVEVQEDALKSLCRKWRIARLEAFGSVLRDDFRLESDVDLLVTFEPEASPSLMALMGAEEEFSLLFGRPVDLVPKSQLKWVIRDRVLAEARPVYAA